MPSKRCIIHYSTVRFIHVSHINFLGRLFAFKDYGNFLDKYQFDLLYSFIWYLMIFQKYLETLYPAHVFLLIFLLELLSDWSTVTWDKGCQTLKCLSTNLVVEQIPRKSWTGRMLSTGSFLSKHRACRGYKMSQSCAVRGCRQRTFLSQPKKHISDDFIIQYQRNSPLF